MEIFENCVCYQEEVRDPTRIAEVLNRVIENAWRGSAPAPATPRKRCSWRRQREGSLTAPIAFTHSRRVERRQFH